MIKLYDIHGNKLPYTIDSDIIPIKGDIIEVKEKSFYVHKRKIRYLNSEFVMDEIILYVTEEDDV